MKSMLETPWWPQLLVEIKVHSVADLAARYGVTPEEIDAGLVESGTGGAAQEEPWWPEILRLHQTGSIRDLSRRFDTTPRRLRRGLARSGVRASGELVGESGVEVLRPHRSRLGKEPDHLIAALAGVAPEVVQGERRRLGIPAYRIHSDIEDERPVEHRRPRRTLSEPDTVIIRRKTQEALRRGAEPMSGEAEVVEESDPGDRLPMLDLPEMQVDLPTADETLHEMLGASYEADDNSSTDESTDESSSTDEPSEAPVRAAPWRANLARPTSLRRPRNDLGPDRHTRMQPSAAREGVVSRQPALQPVPHTEATSGRRRIVRPNLTPIPEPEPAHTPRARTHKAAPAPVRVIVFDKVEERDNEWKKKQAVRLAPKPELPARFVNIQAAVFADLPPSADDHLDDALELPPEADERPVPTVSWVLEPAPREELYAWLIERPDMSPLWVLAPSMLHAVRLAAAHLGREGLGEATAKRVCLAFAS